MKKYLLFMCCATWLLVACEKPVYEGVDGGEDDDPPVVPGDGEQVGEVLWTKNDTARFYLQGVELSGVVLTGYPTPSVLVVNHLYRLPTRLEAAQVLKYADLPKGYWLSKQRILCYDAPTDADVRKGGTQFGTGEYYSFTPHSTVTRAGMKTKYCILPIRSVRIRRKKGMDITKNDEWD